MLVIVCWKDGFKELFISTNKGRYKWPQKNPISNWDDFMLVKYLREVNTPCDQNMNKNEVIR